MNENSLYSSSKIDHKIDRYSTTPKSNLVLKNHSKIFASRFLNTKRGDKSSYLSSCRVSGIPPWHHTVNRPRLGRQPCLPAFVGPKIILTGFSIYLFSKSTYKNLHNRFICVSLRWWKSVPHKTYKWVPY